MSGGQREAGAEGVWSISAAIDSALRAFVDRQPIGAFYDLVRYHLGWPAEGGAPLRPRSVLCVAACQACGGSLEQALPMAVAVALLYGFQLNQEDLERSRESRHGRRSVWSVWGTPQAMNAGDGMHALAKMALLEGRGRLSPATILHLERELDECCLRSCETIDLDISPSPAAAGEGWGEGTPRPSDQTDPSGQAAEGTDALFGLAAAAGCYLAGAADSVQGTHIRRFGELLGSAAGAKARAEVLRADALAALDGGGIAAEHRAVLCTLADYVLNEER